MSPEPTVLSMIEEQISTLDKTLNHRLDTTDRTVNRRFDQQDKQLGEIKRQTQKTNGRVTILENARAHAQGVMFAYKWVPAVLMSAFSAGLTILVMALSGAIH